MTTAIIDPKANETRASVSLMQTRRTLTLPQGIQRLVRGTEPEALRTNAPRVIAPYSNAFIETLQCCYADHHPLVLAPDDVWMVIAQSVALHITQNAESLRAHFVKHQGKVHIECVRDDFVRGSADNDWMAAFGFFSQKIAEHIGEKHDLLTARFSTTGPIELAASEVVLMDAMQHYFSYGVTTSCGIPEVTLLGEPEDWMSVRERVQGLAAIPGLEAWCEALDPITQELVLASTGELEVGFWQDIYKTRIGGSGNPWVSGWANAFFLYVKDHKGYLQNPLALDPKARFTPSSSSYPSGISQVPFTWSYHGERLPYEFLGGFLGIAEDETTLALRPALGWAVRPGAAGG